LLEADYGVSEVKLVDGGDNDPGHKASANPLGVGRDDIPGSPLCAGGADGLLAGLHLVVPETTFNQVCHRELPVLPGIFKPLQEPLSLLVLGDVEKELQHQCPISGQVPLQGVDILEAVGPESFVEPGAGNALGLEQFRMDPDHQDFLVVRAVEDANPASLRERPSVPPKEVVIELLTGGLLEAEDLTALGIDPRHHVLDGAIFAGGIHGLEDRQD